MTGVSTSYHIHTRWSDGSDEMTDYIKAAVAAGLDEIGFSDHYALLPDGRSTSWSLPPDGLAEYLTAIEDAAKSAPDLIMVRAGLEVDFIPAALSDLRRALQPHRFHYLIGSVHMVDDFVVDGSSPSLTELSTVTADQIVREYWRLVSEMAESRLFDIAGHLDVIDKGSPHFTPSFDVLPCVGRALDSMREAGMAIELNTSGWHSAGGHPFPTERILTECLKRGLPVIITADAHQPRHIARDFVRAQELLQRVGYRSTVSLAASNRAASFACLHK